MQRLSKIAHLYITICISIIMLVICVFNEVFLIFKRCFTAKRENKISKYHSKSQSFLITPHNGLYKNPISPVASFYDPKTSRPAAETIAPGYYQPPQNNYATHHAWQEKYPES